MEAYDLDDLIKNRDNQNINNHGFYMCWNGQASAVVAITGLGTALYAGYVKKDPMALWLPLLYFGVMEALQAFTYGVINQCSNPMNQVLTLLSYLHISFQPFFISALSLYFIPQGVRTRIQLYIYALCFISAIFMFIQVYPFDWVNDCHQHRSFCSTRLCAIDGDWHIAWNIPINGIGNIFIELFENGHYWLIFFRSGSVSYAIIVFLLPLLYGSWRFTIYHYIVGPFLSGVLTSNIDEQAAVWCLLSFAILIIVVKTRIRKKFFVKNWFLWPKSWVQG